MGSEPPVHLVPRKAGKGFGPFKEREKTEWAWLSFHWPKGGLQDYSKGRHARIEGETLCGAVVGHS